MYYDKNLFVTEQLRTHVRRVEKKQVIAVICIAVSAIVLYVAALVLLVTVLGTNWQCGYVIPALGAVLYATVFAVLAPLSKRLNKLRIAQTEQLKNTVYYDKYVALLQTGKKLEKLSYSLVIPAIVLGLATSLVLAIIFPYDFYYSYIGFLGATLLLCLLAFLILIPKRKAVRKTESDLVDFFAKQYEAEVAKAQAQEQASEQTAEAAATTAQPQTTAQTTAPTSQQPPQN